MAYFDEMAKRAEQIITFTSVSTGTKIKFPAFITQFSDDYSIAWGGSTIFGRVDPIKNYQSTGRRINCSFDILGRNEEIALKNFENYSRLIQSMYPVYSDPVGSNPKSRTIIAPPLLRIKYANYMSSPRSPDGLLGCIGGLTFQPKFDSGHFFADSGEMIPLVYSMTFVFEPLHEQPLGHDANGFFLDRTFPYNVNPEQEIEIKSVRQSQPASDPMEGD